LITIAKAKRILFFNQAFYSSLLKKSREQLSRGHFCVDSSDGSDDDQNAFACLLVGDFYHWVELSNHFEVFFKTFIKPRKAL
jgi:hypothetical protein